LFCLGLSRNVKNMLYIYIHFSSISGYDTNGPYLNAHCVQFWLLHLALNKKQKLNIWKDFQSIACTSVILSGFGINLGIIGLASYDLWPEVWIERLKLAASNASRSEFAGSLLQDHTLVPSPPPLLVIFLCLAMQFEAASDSTERRTYCTLLKCTLQFLLVQSTPASHITYRELPWPSAATSQIH
jgi:hypothetical protein